MNKNDLFNLLDIKPNDAKAIVPVDEKRMPTRHSTADTAAKSDYVLDLDRWDIDRGKRCKVESDQFANTTEETAADFYALYFQTNPIVQECGCVDTHRQPVSYTQLTLPTN